MPWNETDVMTEKERFIMLAQTGRFTITDLCADFGISRKTGHKYLQRYQADGRHGLNDYSRRPKDCPFTTSAAVEKLILKERKKHATWGPKKIHDRLLKVYGLEDRPHINTINNILSRRGLTKKRKRKPGVHRVLSEGLKKGSNVENRITN